MINSKIFNTLILVLTFLIGKGQPEGKPDIRKVYDNLDLVGGSMLTNAYYFSTPDISGLIPFDQSGWRQCVAIGPASAKRWPVRPMGSHQNEENHH